LRVGNGGRQMVLARKRRAATVDEIVADAKAGIFRCSLDEDIPPELLGPLTEAELREEAAKLNGGAGGNGAIRRNGRQANGVAAGTSTSKKTPRP
jgi:hypothetical protein